MRIVIVVLAMAFWVSSCDEQRVYEQNRDFDDRAWLVDDQPVFDFEIADSLATYNLFGNVRNSVSYPYSRLFFNWYLLDSAGNAMDEKLAQIFLFDQQSGEPLGDSGLGDIYDQRISLKENFRFPYSGKFSMKFKQDMRLDTLPGILAIGFRVEKNQPN